MIHSAEELKEKLKHFEYESPEPISKVPSVALRQAVADVRKVVAAGATIDMAHWGQINGQCAVCCAGAVLLARGYFGRHADKSYKERRPSGNIGLDDGGLWNRDPDAGLLADVFNGVRLSEFHDLLYEWCALDDAVARSLLEELSAAGLAAFVYYGQNDAAEVEDMCRDLLRVADFFEQKGH